MTHEERALLVPGDRVRVVDDNGRVAEYEVKSAPWRLGHGEWVVGLKGISGGYALSRVVARVLDPGRVQEAACQMLGFIEGEYAKGVANGYWPVVGEQLDRWRAALGLPPLERYARAKRCPIASHHPTCDCGGVAGNR